MTKSELIDTLARKQSHLAYRDVELAVKELLEVMSQSLANGERIEVRGFGSFSLHYRPPRMGRNPKSGDPVVLRGKYVPHFKPGKQLREQVNVLPLKADVRHKKGDDRDEDIDSGPIGRSRSVGGRG